MIHRESFWSVLVLILISIVSTSNALSGTIDGLVYGDTNANALRDGREEALAGWSVYIDLSEDGEFDEGEPTAMTDALGLFTFNEVFSGTYFLGVRGLEVRAVDTPGGGGNGGAPFREFRNDAIVVGFDTWTHSLFLGRDLIGAVQAIFRTPSGRLIGGETHGIARGRRQRLLAKEGYAVGGIRLRSGVRVDGFAATFMGVMEDGLLDAKDAYDSPHAGGPGGNPSEIGYTDQPVIGVWGREGADLDAMGLVMHANVQFENAWPTAPKGLTETQLKGDGERVTVRMGVAPVGFVNAPVKVSVAQPGEGVVLEWSDASPRHPDIATHTIWRATGPDAKFSRVDEGQIAGNSWVDLSTSGATEYCWSVRAVTAAGDESDVSEAVCLTTRAWFRRGFADGDAQMHISDPIAILQFLFGPGSLTCLESADVNNDDRVDVSDAIGLLGFLFLGTLAPPAPFEHCGVDPESGSLGCVINGACE